MTDRLTPEREAEIRQRDADAQAQGIITDRHDLLAELDAVRALWQKHQWVSDEGSSYCPVCLLTKRQGHADDCELVTEHIVDG